MKYPASLNALLDGERHDLDEEFLSGADSGRRVAGWTEVEGEDLDPYESPTAIAVWEYGVTFDRVHKLVHAKAELNWARFIIPFGYLARAVGGFEGYQVGYADPTAQPPLFRFTFIPGRIRTGERI